MSMVMDILTDIRQSLQNGGVTLNADKNAKSTTSSLSGDGVEEGADKSKGKSASVSFGQCLVYEYDKDTASSNPPKKVDTKDISDMRDEKTKIRDMLQAKENEEVLKIQKLREMMNTSAGAQDDKDKSAPSPDKFADEKG